MVGINIWGKSKVVKISFVIGIALVLIGTAGYIFIISDTEKVTQNETETPTVSLLEYKDTAGKFTFNYPASWEKLPYQWEPCCDGEEQPEPDWSEVPQPLRLKPPDTPEEIAVNVYPDASGTRTLDMLWRSRMNDDFNRYSRFESNGNDVMLHKTDFKSKDGNEKYTIYRYFSGKGELVVEFQFKAKYSNTAFNGEKDFDVEATYQNDLSKMVSSVRFL